MNVYDKLLTELQNEKVQFYGNLLFPNHFRITVHEGIENLFLCFYVVKNHNFSFFTINSTSLTSNIEFFFYYHFSGRNFLFSVVCDFNKDKKYILNSVTSFFPQAKHIEKLIETISPITFQNTVRNKK